MIEESYDRMVELLLASMDILKEMIHSGNIDVYKFGLHAGIVNNSLFFIKNVRVRELEKTKGEDVT